MCWVDAVPNKTRSTTRHKKRSTEIKVAIVHDWLYGGGAEKVVEQLHKIYPDAPIYTSYCTDEWRKKLDNKVITGYLQNWPFCKLRKFLPILRIRWFESLDLTDYDLIISSSGSEAKGVKNIKPGAMHINYCHAPTHYYWSRYDEYLEEPGFGSLNTIVRLGLKSLVTPLRSWDYNAAQRPNHIIANSTHIKNNIKEYYDRESTVIYPPVNIARFKKYASNKKRSGLIVVGRQVPYKRFDLAILAAIKTNMQLIVVGNGPMREKLVDLAKGHENIIFLTNVTDKQLPHLISEAEYFLFPGIEDFGITPVEAMACGTPVIAYGQGGALDYITSQTGILFKTQTTNAIARAITKAQQTTWEPTDISKSTDKFSVENFQKHIKKFIKSVQ